MLNFRAHFKLAVLPHLFHLKCRIGNNSFFFACPDSSPFLTNPLGRITGMNSKRDYLFLILANVHVPTEDSKCIVDETWLTLSFSGSKVNEHV